MSLPPEPAEQVGDVVTSPAASASNEAADHRASYRQILKATSVIGGAQVISIVIGIGRTKVFALLVGPAGVGLFGLLNTLMTTAGTVMQMGMGAVGTRQIAEAHGSGDQARMALARRALWIAAVVLSVLGGGGVWLLREPLAIHVLHNVEQADAIGWIGLGVGFSVAALWQSSLIQGMSRMWDLAWLRIGGAILVTVAGLPIIWAFGDAAIPFFVILMPLASFVLGQIFVARIEKPTPIAITLPELATQWRMFFVLGLPIVFSSVIGMVATVWIQSHITTELGIVALGFYVASNTIAVQYSNLVLTAMVGDFFPRLSGLINDRVAARQLVNQQTEVVILLAGPVILAIFAFAPWMIKLLYSSQFAPAADVLRWQAIGSLLMVIAWPMSFILLAAGAGRAYFLTSVAQVLVMALATALLIGRFSLAGAGMAYLVAYLVYLPMLFVFARRQIGFVWSAPVWRALGVLGLALAGLIWPVLAPTPLTIAGGAAIAGAASIFFLRRTNQIFDLGSLVRRFSGVKS